MAKTGSHSRGHLDSAYGCHRLDMARREPPHHQHEESQCPRKSALRPRIGIPEPPRPSTTEYRARLNAASVKPCRPPVEHPSRRPSGSNSRMCLKPSKRRASAGRAALMTRCVASLGIGRRNDRLHKRFGNASLKKHFQRGPVVTQRQLERTVSKRTIGLDSSQALRAIDGPIHDPPRFAHKTVLRVRRASMLLR